MRIEKTNESEPRMTCRKANYRYQNQVALLAWDKPMGYLCYCVGGIRHGSGVSSIQALVWNLGTWGMIYLKVYLRGGVTRSSDEVYESTWSKGVTSVSGNHKSTNYGRNL